MSGANLRFVNSLILILLITLTLTGVYGLFFPFPTMLFDIHRIAAWALIALLPWKAIISLRSLRRGLDHRFDRNIMVAVSVVIATATLLILAFGLMWKWNLGEYYVWLVGYGYSVIGWHWGIALYLLLPLYALHTWRRWHHPKKTDFAGRRQALKLLGLGAAAVVGWGISEGLARIFQEEDAPRRFTGSREAGSFEGNAHPVTSGPDQGKIKLDPATWTLSVTGAVKSPITLSYEILLTMSKSELTATLDCTGGWYTVQTWRGVWLVDLLNQARVRSEADGVVMKGVFEYSAPFTLSQVEEILLATHVTGQILNHSHGFPLRAVIPSRRGWHWVKWLTEINVVSIL